MYTCVIKKGNIIKFKLLDLYSYHAGEIYIYEDETYFAITERKFLKLDEELSIHKVRDIKGFVQLSSTFISDKYLDILKEIPNKYILTKSSERALNKIIENLFHRYYNIQNNDKTLPLFVDHGFGGIYEADEERFLFKINSFEFIALDTMEVVQYNGKLDSPSYTDFSVSEMKKLVISLEKMDNTFLFESYHQTKMDDFIKNFKSGLKSKTDNILAKTSAAKKEVEKKEKYNKENTISLVKNFIVNEEHAINLKLVSGISYIKGFIHLNCGAQIYKFDIAKEQFKEIRDSFISLGEESVTF